MVFSGKTRLVSIVSQPKYSQKKPGLKTSQIIFRKNVSIFSQNNFQTLAQKLTSTASYNMLWVSMTKIDILGQKNG